MTEIIRSPHNPLLKRIRSLGTRKTRYAERAFVLEGARSFAAALEVGITPEITLVSDDASPDLFALAGHLPHRIATRAIFDQVMDTETPQGIAGIFAMPRSERPAVDEPLLIVLDAISDPGNLGTIIRTAAAAGADGILLGPDCVDPFNPKAVRSAMGALFAIPLLFSETGNDRWLCEQCPNRWLADGSGADVYDAPIWRGGVAIIIGSEAHGATAWGRALATGRVRIPMARSIESLNAAVAASILLFEATRQRTNTGSV